VIRCPPLLPITIAMVAVPSLSRAQPDPSLERLAWLTGCWEASAADATVEEQWTTPRGGVMLGVNRTARDGRLISYEFLVLDGREASVIYVAHPSGQAAATFSAEAVSDARVVFGNPAHDYPQRIGYERRATDSLFAWIEGPQDGELRRVEFAFVRVPCPGF
jgi:hypothetical protein